MATESRTIVTKTCDLCGFSTTGSDRDWGKLRGQMSAGGALVNNYEADVCPECAASFRVWQQCRSVPSHRVAKEAATYEHGEDPLGQSILVRKVT